jgi:flagellar assembly protein FliH
MSGNKKFSFDTEFAAGSGGPSPAREAPREPSGAKFTFDTEFRAQATMVSESARLRRKKTMTVEEIENMCARAHREGTETAQVRANEAVNQTLAAMIISLRAALDQTHEAIDQLRGEAAQLAFAAARKMASAALDTFPAADVENALRQAMHQAIGEPRITLRAAPEVIAVLAPRLEAIAQSESYEGRVLAAAEPTLKSGDCRIEWRGGGSERNHSALAEALENLISRRFADPSDSA